MIKDKVAPLEFNVPLPAMVVRMEVNDVSVITRCIANWDEEGTPRPLGTDGWRDTYYDFDTVGGVLDHLAYNFAMNGVTEINRLGGWADCAPDAVRFELTHQ